MGIVCGFYRMNEETIKRLKSEPELAQNFIDENYSWANGKYHLVGDTVFETDKAWDIAKFLLKKCDTSTDKVLSKLDGVKIESLSDWNSPRYISFEDVKKIHQVLETISFEQLMKLYDQQELVENNVYRASSFDEPDWDYFLSHIQTIKKAFARAAQFQDWIVINFH